MKLRSIPMAAAAVAAVAFSLPQVASANLVLVAPQDFAGTGLGSVNTVLTIQSPGSSSSESGGVAFGGGGVDVAFGDAKTGASQTLTRSFADLSITSAADIRVVFNAAEPGGDSITLNTLVLNIYSSTGGSPLFTSGAVSCPTVTGCAFPDTFTGTGNSGFVFALDATQAALAQPFFAANNRIGLTASASNATGGQETFFVASAGGVTTPVPEPETYALMLAGLGVLGFVAKRRKVS
ncbi:MAG: PEP-CTERM sorting domain-containing protein [Caldimonas sp.]